MIFKKDNLLIVAATSVIFSAFMIIVSLSQQQTISSLTTELVDQSSLDDMVYPTEADWQTYTNTDYGFSFKYPSDLIKQEKTEDFSLVSIDFKSPDYRKKPAEIGEEIVSGYSYYLAIRELDCQQITNYPDDPSIKNYQSFVVGNEPGHRFHFSWDGSSAETVTVDLKNHCLVFSESHSPSYKESWSDNFSKILSTFKFLD